MKFQPVKLLFRGLRKCPGMVGRVAKAVCRADKAVDQVADLGERRQRKLVHRIRDRSGQVVLILGLALLCGGCATARMLQAEGHEVRATERVELGFWDVVGWFDCVKDAIRDWSPFSGGEEAK